VRTTITLEDDVAASLKRLEKRRGMKFKALVNQALREGLKCMTAPAKKRSVFRTRAVDLGMRTGRLNGKLLPIGS